MKFDLYQIRISDAIYDEVSSMIKIVISCWMQDVIDDLNRRAA